MQSICKNIFSRLHGILPEKVSSNNAILRLYFLPDQIQINSRSVTSKYAVWRAEFFKIGENLLLQRYIFDDGLYMFGKN